jgi:energy-converting hydrogenase Eha subunit G
MLTALLMMRRLLVALRVALRDEDFGRVLSAGVALIIIGTLAYTLGNDWSVVDGLYVAVATLTTSSILDPDLTITDLWLKIFTAGYVLVGIGILVEIARRLGMGFIAARAEVKEASRSSPAVSPPG